MVDIWVSKALSASPYAHYEYDAKQNNISIAYGNGQTVYYSYDSDDNLISQSYKADSDAQTVKQFDYVYTNGEMNYKVDYINNRTEWYEDGLTSVYTLAYDENGEIIKGAFLSSYEDTSVGEDDNTSVHTDKNNAGELRSVYSENSDSYETSGGIYNFTYESNEDLSTSSTTVTKDGGEESIIKYDYTYDDDGNVTGYTVTTPSYSKQYVYAYDDEGRITSYGTVKDGALNPDDCSYYHYDSKGQLVRADENINKNPSDGTKVYEYDSRGNLERIDYYNYSSGELTVNPYSDFEIDYSYDENVWIDAIDTLESSESRFIYDENGNPISYDDLEFNWTNGRMLSSIEYEDENSNTQTLISYTYDDDGIRTSKTYGDTTTYFTTVDGAITSQYELDENNNVINLIEFIYDSSNDVIGFIYDNNTYFYIKNVQGDIISIADSDGNVLVDYYYHTWGYSSFDDYSDNDLASINPMRFKGYYEDTEIGFCYLQSRYYVPELFRFLNSDLPTIAQEHKGEVNGLNLFAYCGNEPVNNSDPTGYYNGYKAMNYAINYYKIPNPKYYYYKNGDCANFVSQCLYAGASKWGWHCYKNKNTNVNGRPVITYDRSHAWAAAQNLYDWLKKNNFISTTYVIRNKNDVNWAGKFIKDEPYCSAVIFFDWNNKEQPKGINHAALLGEIVNSKKLYDIYFYAHTNDRNGKRYLNGKRQYTSIKDIYNNKNYKNMIVRICLLRY